MKIALIIGRDADEGIEEKGAAEMNSSVAIPGIRPPNYAKQINFYHMISANDGKFKICNDHACLFC